MYFSCISVLFQLSWAGELLCGDIGHPDSKGQMAVIRNLQVQMQMPIFIVIHQT
jgi:hypothetical protein